MPKTRYFSFLRVVFATRFCYPLPMKIRGLYKKRGWYYYQPPTVDGKRPPAIALRTQDLEGAIDQAYKLHSQKALQPQSKLHMDALLDLYLADRAAARIHTLKTADITRKTLSRLSKDWGNPEVKRIDRKMVEAWRTELQERKGLVGATMSEASIGSYLRRLSGFLSWLVAEKHIREHPMKDIRLGRVKKTKRERFCTVEEREKLLVNPPNQHIDFILHFGFFAGLRFGEMLAMQSSWLTPREGGWLLTVQETPFWKPKDKECRSIEVHPRLAAFIERHGFQKPFMLNPHKPKWVDPPAYRYNPKKAFKTHAAAKGIGWVTYHTLRHSFATHLAAKGAKMVEIAELLGDSLRVVEETYIGYAPKTNSAVSKI